MVSDAILVPTWFHFGSQNPPKSRLGDVLRRLGGVLERLGGVLGGLGASWAVIERSGDVPGGSRARINDF